MTLERREALTFVRFPPKSISDRHEQGLEEKKRLMIDVFNTVIDSFVLFKAKAHAEHEYFSSKSERQSQLFRIDIPMMINIFFSPLIDEKKFEGNPLQTTALT